MGIVLQRFAASATDRLWSRRGSSCFRDGALFKKRTVCSFNLPPASLVYKLDEFGTPRPERRVQQVRSGAGHGLTRSLCAVTRSSAPGGLAEHYMGDGDEPIRLFSGPLSMFGAKAQIAVLEKGLEVELVMVPFGMDRLYEPKHPEVLRINPKRQVPVLVHGAVEIFDSTQIFEYLEDLRPEPALWPAGIAERARARLFELKSDEVFFPHVIRLMGLSGEPDDPAAVAARDGASRYYGEMEALLGDRAFLAGPYSFADIAFYMAQLFGERMGAPLTAATPQLLQWRDRMTARPAVRQVVGPMASYLLSLGRPIRIICARSRRRPARRCSPRHHDCRSPDVLVQAARRSLGDPDLRDRAAGPNFVQSTTDQAAAAVEPPTGAPLSLCARRRKARTRSMIPKIRAKAPIHHVTTMTPASGATTSSTPKMTDATPLRMSHQRPYSGWRRTAATISSTPVTIAHAAIRSTKVSAVSPGQISAIMPTAMLRTPSSTRSPQRW